MKLSNKRRQMLYSAASEPVMQARIKIARLLADDPRGREVDEILFEAMNKAGQWAIEAIDPKEPAEQ